MGEQGDSQESLAWSGAPTRRLIELSWPICLSTLSYAVYTIVDTWFVADMGDHALAAVSLGGVLCFSLIWFSRGVLGSVKLKISQDIGAKEHTNLDRWLHHGFRLAWMLGLLSVVVGVGISFAMPLLAHTPLAGSLAQQYFLIRLSGVVCCLLAACLREALFGEGESRIPLWASLAASGSNVALDALFVLHFSWGVQGVALATALSYLVDLAVLLVGDYRRRRRIKRASLRLSSLWTLRWDGTVMGELWRLGWPMGVANFLEVGAFAMLTVIIAKVGNQELAAHQIALQALHFAFLPILALGEGVSILVSESYGARQNRWMLGLGLRGLLLALGVVALSILVIVGFAPQIAWQFGSDPALHHKVIELFHIAAYFQVADAANIVGRCVLRGVQDVKFVSFVTIAVTWLLTCPLAYYLVYYQGLGAKGAWWALCAEMLLVATVMWVRIQAKHRKFRRALAPG